MQESPHPEQPFAAHDHFSKAPRRNAQLERILSPPGGLIRRYTDTSPLGVVNSARIYGCRNWKFTMRGHWATARR
jgi:hypothetical protein